MAFHAYAGDTIVIAFASIPFHILILVQSPNLEDVFRLALMGGGNGDGRKRDRGRDLAIGFHPKSWGGFCDLLHSAEYEAIVFHKSTTNAYSGESRSIKMSRLSGTKSGFLMLPVFNFIYRYSISRDKKTSTRFSTSQASRLTAIRLRPCRASSRKCKPVNCLQPLGKQREGLEVWHRKDTGAIWHGASAKGPEAASKQVKSEVTKSAEERKASKRAYEAQEA